VAAPRLICGVDEAGRGPLAGPVFAAAVVFHPGKRAPKGIEDSKLLSARQRERLAGVIKARSLVWAWHGERRGDRRAEHPPGKLARDAARSRVARVAPDEVLLDGSHCPQLPFPARAVVDGDAKVKVISAASILAKTARDAEMQRLHQRFPQYGFDEHKGYPTLST